MRHVQSLTLALALTLLLGGCAAAPEEIPAETTAETTEATPRHYATFSILGDSYSTYEGMMTPRENYSWYPSALLGTGVNDVELPEHTWWLQFAEEYGSVLVENNSFSGSRVVYGEGIYSFTSYVARADDLKPAELIIVEGGTNDYWGGLPLGEYRYEGWTEESLMTFRPALAYVLATVREAHPNAEILFMLNNGFDEAWNESVAEICAHYNVPLLALVDISKQTSHPDRVGMTQIKDQLIAFLAEME